MVDYGFPDITSKSALMSLFDSRGSYFFKAQDFVTGENTGSSHARIYTIFSRIVNQLPDNPNAMWAVKPDPALTAGTSSSGATAASGALLAP